ncbi:hypothetical protein AAC387_Pa12g2368 [Persea americana]|eukprot:TRINITY_DN14847_c0_g1_i1.p1 TRINITY_DN14847_c0_g1~~TRINITY_DN14847_c0_g1_i1.p1  ORF type:complete len:942 (-),score=212.86 TRINITY_DN14847_c0_g1_i1:215-3040(-)
MKRVLDPNKDHIVDKPITYELSRSSSHRKSNGTPMKMLIAQEMSNEKESKLKPPSVVARLMGLDGMPAQQPVSTLQKSSSEGYLQNASTRQGSVPRHQLRENDFLDKHHHSQSYSIGQSEYKDVRGIWHRSMKSGSVKDQLKHKARHNENENDKKMDLVRQKFIEAKRLATDEKLRQSKEFQDALEVLSSNRDLFLKFLQEPNSLFSKHLYELQSVPPPPQTKRITVLKPSKTQQIDRCIGQDMMSEKTIKKQHQAVQLNEWDNKKPSWNSVSAHQKAEYQPTRIVVLKPSPGKTHDIKTLASSPILSTELPHDKDFYGESGTDALKRSREISKDIMNQMQQSVNGDKRDEALLLSVLSDGYEGDESKRRLENEYMKEGNFSDSEIMTPSSRHSWDYVRYGSPYSTSSLSRASYTSESSVTREAKKRLSERWEMMMSTGSSQEHRQVRRSSSTLGEMLALSDMKKPVKSGEESNHAGPSVSSSRSCGGEEDLRLPRPQLSNHVDEDEGEEHSPRNLSRSRSVPISSTVYEKVGLNIETPDPNISKTIVLEEVAKPKSGKSSLKVKVSSFFFSRNKKPSKEKSVPSAPNSSHVGLQPSSGELMGTSPKQLSFGLRSDHNLEWGTNCNLEGKSLSRGEPSCRISSLTGSPVRSNQGTCTSEASLSMEKPQLHENSSENQEQPSPISVLEARFEDDASTPESFEIPKGDDHELPAHFCHKSESTAKCQIELVTRNFMWDENAISETSTPLSLESSAVSSRAAEGQWFSFVQALLSAAGLNSEMSNAVFARWHSAESPLDPSLLEKFMDQKQEVRQLNEAKRRQWRSECRLLFDCVNAALLDMVKCRIHAVPLTSARCKSVEAGASVTEEVWGRLREWFSGQARWLSAETDTSLIIEGEVREEVVGSGWEEMVGLEIEGIGKEIERKMLEELLGEALADLACGLL